MTVWIYVDMNKPDSDLDRLKVFASSDAADEWFKVHDPEGVAFAYPVIDAAAPLPGERSDAAEALSGPTRAVRQGGGWLTPYKSGQIGRFGGPVAPKSLPRPAKLLTKP